MYVYVSSVCTCDAACVINRQRIQICQTLNSKFHYHESTWKYVAIAVKLFHYYCVYFLVNNVFSNSKQNQTQLESIMCLFPHDSAATAIELLERR